MKKKKLRKTPWAISKRIAEKANCCAILASAHFSLVRSFARQQVDESHYISPNALDANDVAHSLILSPMSRGVNWPFHNLVTVSIKKATRQRPLTCCKLCPPFNIQPIIIFLSKKTSSIHLLRLLDSFLHKNVESIGQRQQQTPHLFRRWAIKKERNSPLAYLSLLMQWCSTQHPYPILELSSSTHMAARSESLGPSSTFVVCRANVITRHLSLSL